ncbi:MAG: hypothetical protein JWR54_1619 [Mucilaginibacter sp.]|nr:hypothetical protein [Mucilaginibacter sp.]
MGNLTIHRRKRALASVEDSKEYNLTLQDIATAAGEEAIIEAKVLKIPVTYLSGTQVVKKFPDGKIEVIKQISKSKTSAVLRKGTILHARKG